MSQRRAASSASVETLRRPLPPRPHRRQSPHRHAALVAAGEATADIDVERLRCAQAPLPFIPPPPPEPRRRSHGLRDTEPTRLLSSSELDLSQRLALPPPTPPPLPARTPVPRPSLSTRPGYGGSLDDFDELPVGDALCSSPDWDLDEDTNVLPGQGRTNSSPRQSSEPRRRALPPWSSVPVPPPPSSPTCPSVPEYLGPLPEMVSAAEADTQRLPALQLGDPTVELPQPEIPPEAPPPPPQLLPLERCAVLAARTDVAPAYCARTLRDARVDEKHLAASQQHHQAVIDEDLRRGDSTSLIAYDEAYVDEIEKLCGAIEPEHQALIELSSERGEVDETLDELGLPPPALMRIRRVGTQRMCKLATERARYFEALGR